jgi:hypothetical protein
MVPSTRVYPIFFRHQYRSDLVRFSSTVLARFQRILTRNSEFTMCIGLDRTRLQFTCDTKPQNSKGQSTHMKTMTKRFPHIHSNTEMAMAIPVARLCNHIECFIYIIIKRQPLCPFIYLFYSACVYFISCMVCCNKCNCCFRNCISCCCTLEI